MAEIKLHEWFQKDYTPVGPYDDDDEDVRLGAILPVKQVWQDDTNCIMLKTNLCPNIGIVCCVFDVADR